MATRLYINNTAPEIVPSTFQGAWGQTIGAIDLQLDATKIGAIAQVDITETNATSGWDAAIARLTTGELAAQTISGTIDGIVALTESAAEADLSLHLYIYVRANDGTIRGVLLNDYVEPATAEFSTAAITGGKQLASPQTLTPVTCQPGDRVVAEVGYRAYNSVATSYYTRFRYGGTGVDLTANGDGTVGTGWLEFSQTLAFAAEARIYQQVAELAANPMPALMTYQVVQELAANPQPQLLVYQHVMETAVNPQPELRTYQHVIEVAVVPVPITRPFVQAFIVG